MRSSSRGNCTSRARRDGLPALIRGAPLRELLEMASMVSANSVAGKTESIASNVAKLADSIDAAFCALELAAIQLDQCVRLLNGDDEFLTALQSVRNALQRLEPFYTDDTSSAGPDSRTKAL